MNIEQEAAGLAPEEVEIEEISQSSEPSLQIGHIFSGLLDLFKVETGQGDLESYKNSPLCFDQSSGLAQMLRGCSGFIGANLLRSAIIDIVLGFWRWTGKGGKPSA